MNKRKILCDKIKGKEFSKVSNEIRSQFYSWLEYSNIDITEFNKRIERQPYEISKNPCGNEYMEIILSAGADPVLAPLVLYPDANGKYESGLTEAALLLLYISSNYGNKYLKEKVEEFSKYFVTKG